MPASSTSGMLSSRMHAKIGRIVCQSPTKAENRRVEVHDQVAGGHQITVHIQTERDV
jgi:hypothetical protein